MIIQSVRTILVGIISFCLFNPHPVWAQTPSNLDIPINEYLDNLEALIPEAATAGAVVETHLEKITPVLLESYKNLMVLVNQKRAGTPERDFKVLLTNNRLSESIPGFGKVELRVVGKVLVARVIENETQNAYLVSDMENWPSDPKELEQSMKSIELLIANNQMDSGRTGNQINRDTFLVTFNGGNLQTQKSFPRPVPGTPEFRKAWRTSTFNPITKGSFRVGLVMGPLQFGLTYGISLIKGVNEWHSALVNGVLGAVISTNFPTFQNLTGRPNRDLTSPYYQSPKNLRELVKSDIVRRTIKKSVFSFSVATMLYATHHGFASVNFFNALSVASINILMRSLGKDSFDQIGYLMRDFQEAKGTVRLRGFGREWDTQMPRDVFYGNLLQLVPTALSVISLFGKGLGVYEIPIHPFGPGYPLLFPYYYPLMIPLMAKIKVVYAEHVAKILAADPLAFQKAEEVQARAAAHRQKWDRTWGMPVKNIPGAVKKKFNLTMDNLGRMMGSCSHYFGSADK